MRTSALLLFFFVSCPVVEANAAACESFVVKKKRRNKIGRKSKVQVCTSFGNNIKSCSVLTGKIAWVQNLELEQVFQYLEGEDDPFVKFSKKQSQELVRRAELLNQQIEKLSAACDEFVKYVQQLPKNTAPQTCQRQSNVAPRPQASA